MLVENRFLLSGIHIKTLFNPNSYGRSLYHGITYRSEYCTIAYAPCQMSFYFWYTTENDLPRVFPMKFTGDNFFLNCFFKLFFLNCFVFCLLLCFVFLFVFCFLFFSMISNILSNFDFYLKTNLYEIPNFCE